MGTQTEAGREFWHGVLMTGGFTAIPRWIRFTRQRCQRASRHRSRPIWRRSCVAWPSSSQSPPSAVLLAAHAKVLSALSGEGEVTTGYVPAQGYLTDEVPAADQCGVMAVN